MAQGEGRNLWPLGIATVVMVVVGMVVWTVVMAVSHPVQEDSRYDLGYQEVDEQINELLRSEQAFDRLYQVSLEPQILFVGTNTVTVRVNALSPHSLPHDRLQIEARLSRPHSNEENEVLGPLTWDGMGFRSEPFEIPLAGRWLVELVISAEETRAFKRFERFAPPPQ